MEIRNKKQFIIDKWLKDKNTNFDKFELDSNYVWRVIDDYKKQITISYQIGCAKSFDLKNIYYIFVDDEEKTIEVRDNFIINFKILTEYELRWLELNKGWEY